VRGGTAGAWIELSVVADTEAVESVSEILTRVAPGGTSVEPAFELVDEGLSARLDPARPAIVRAYVPAADPHLVEAAIERARRDLGHLQAFGLRPIGELASRVVVEADWADAWKTHVPVLRIGRRLVIRPTWRRHRRRPGDVVLSLDPGMAFGTGLHPTTRLCLAALEALADGGGLTAGSPDRVAAGVEPDQPGRPDRPRRTGARVLDVGCGSGILAIAALRLGAGTALGVDPDPIAVEATRANARRTHVARRLRARTGSVPTGAAPFDVVVANLIASLLVDLAHDLAGELRRGGTLVASGIFIDREAAVRTAFETVGLSLVERREEGDWVALLARRTA
jgi:ribosomal protein L11 methyltransferase